MQARTSPVEATVCVLFLTVLLVPQMMTIILQPPALIVVREHSRQPGHPGLAIFMNACLVPLTTITQQLQHVSYVPLDATLQWLQLEAARR